MTQDELYGLLEIDSPEDVEYFEQLADLLESDEDIPEDLFGLALSAIGAAARDSTPIVSRRKGYISSFLSPPNEKLI